MKILIIEDETRIALTLKKTLELDDHQVKIAFDSDKGLELAKDKNIDLIIMDLMLPGKYDGISLTKYLRSQKIDTPILMLTALEDVKNRVKGLSAGADDYLPKPFSLSELQARIKALAKRPKKIVGPILKVDDLTLDTATKQVKRSGKSIKLSSKEFRLLSYLMFNKDQIISKDKIISHLWNDESFVVKNTIEVYVGYLRKKVDKAFSNRPELIHTIRGFGYKIGLKK